MCYRTRKEPLIYSEEFKKAVINEYPHDTEMKKLLDNNDYFVGRCLNDGAYSSIPYDMVIERLEAGETDELLKTAYHIKRLVDLYEMWDKEVFLD